MKDILDIENGDRVAVKSEMWGIAKDMLEKYLREYDDLPEAWYKESPYQGYDVWKYLIEKIEGKKLDGSEFPITP